MAVRYRSCTTWALKQSIRTPENFAPFAESVQLVYKSTMEVGTRLGDERGHPLTVAANNLAKGMVQCIVHAWPIMPPLNESNSPIAVAASAAIGGFLDAALPGSAAAAPTEHGDSVGALAGPAPAAGEHSVLILGFGTMKKTLLVWAVG